jgi:hypothetical protein
MTFPSEKLCFWTSILFADDTIVIISSRNVWNFYTQSNSYIIKWLAANKLVVKLDKCNEIYNEYPPHSALSYWIWSKVFRRDGEYKIPWFTNWLPSNLEELCWKNDL